MEKITDTDIIKNKINLITDRLGEVVGMNDLFTIISERSPKIYWGTAPTGKIHIGYLIPLLKIADCLDAGCEIKILIADLHAILDNMKSTPELVEYRTQYYQEMIKCILFNLGVPLEKLEFIKGTSFQMSPQYTMDVYKLMALTSLNDAKRSGAEVVKQTDNPKLSGMAYPLLQALDEQYLDVDIQIGGIDQRKIMMYARESLPLIGYKKRIHLMNPMLTSISALPSDVEVKMSSSDQNSKIDLLDGKNEVKKKINRAYCLEGDLKFNPLVDLVEHIIFPLLYRLHISSFEISRPEKYGGPSYYSNIDQLKHDFAEKKLHPQDLKNGITSIITKFIEPIKSHFEKPEFKTLLRNAYP